MPYSTISALPKSIRDNLPKGAQKIFRSTVNSALKSGKTEESAFKIAWSAVKVKYRKVGTEWVKKALSTPAFVQGAILSRENLAPMKKPKKPKK